MPIDRRRLYVWAGFGFEAGLGLLALGLGWLTGLPVWQSLKLGPIDPAWGLAATAPLLAGLLYALRSTAGPLVRIRALCREVFVPFLRPCRVWELAALAAAAGVGEELFFRAFLQGLGERWLGFLPAWLLTSALFGLVHAVTPAYAVIATLIGLYFGAVWSLTGSLPAVMMAHGLYDFIALIVLVRLERPPDAETRAPDQSG
jgi:hypothetical protein